MKMKWLRNVLCTGVVGGTVLFAGMLEAAIVTDCVPMLTYADRNVPTYDQPNGPKKGFITPSISLVYIKQIREDGWAYGSYPLAGGKRIYRWFRMDDLQGFTDFENYEETFYGDRIVYRTSSGNNKIGNLWNRMDALVVGALGDNLKIIYRANGNGEYKMGWVPKYVDDDDYYGGDGNGGTFKGSIIKVYGDVNNMGSIDTSVNDNSVHDESYHDNSTNTNTEVQDNSYHDHSRTNNTNITDNSQNTTTTNVDNSQTNVNSNNERSNTEHRQSASRKE